MLTKIRQLIRRITTKINANKKHQQALIGKATSGLLTEGERQRIFRHRQKQNPKV